MIEIESLSSYYSRYINPLIAVLIGWLVADEQVTGLQVIALAVFLVGVVLTQLSQSRAES